MACHKPACHHRYTAGRLTAGGAQQSDGSRHREQRGLRRILRLPRCFGSPMSAWSNHAWLNHPHFHLPAPSSSASGGSGRPPGHAGAAALSTCRVGRVPRSWTQMGCWTLSAALVLWWAMRANLRGKRSERGAALNRDLRYIKRPPLIDEGGLFIHPSMLATPFRLLR